MERYLHKFKKALKEPGRAVRLVWREAFHKVVVLTYLAKSTCTFEVRGKRIVFDTRDWYSKEWFFPRCDRGRYHEPSVTELLARLMPGVESFMDVGAHLGYFAVIAGKLRSDIPVRAYEMDERAYERLVRNLVRNGLTEAKARHTAIAGKSGQVRYHHLPHLDSGESLAYADTYEPTRIVQGLTLDDAFAAENVPPGLIKIDVEGAEYDVLRGGEATLAARPTLLLEIHGRKLGRFGADSQKVLRFLTEQGFSTYEITDHRAAVEPRLALLSPDAPPFDRNTMTLVLPNESVGQVEALASDDTKTHFNTVAQAAYEARRWDANPRVRGQQEATEHFVRRVAQPLARHAKRIMELGPGPGTWTRFLYNARPDASFVLLDISSEMLARAREAIPEAQVETREGDFATVAAHAEEADFFFSSRAIEYVTDKEAMARKILSALRPGGTVCIITKTPKPLMNRLSGRRPKPLHRLQVRPSELRRVLRRAGAQNVRLYPVTFAVPFLRSERADRVAATLFRDFALNPVSSIFTESYAVTCRKP